jgi:hypothetical protein
MLYIQNGMVFGNWTYKILLREAIPDESCQGVINNWVFSRIHPVIALVGVHELFFRRLDIPVLPYSGHSRF